MSNPNPPVAAAPAPRWFVGLMLIALAAYAAFLSTYTTVAAAGSDSSGYLNSARLLASGRLQEELRIPAEFGAPDQLNLIQFTPHGFFPYSHSTQLPPTYPTGLPLHFALASLLFGWTLGPLLVEVGAALAAVWLFYRLARELGLDCWLSAAGATALAVCPVLLFTSVQPLSDTLATTWCLAAMLTGLRSQRNARWAAAAGLSFSIAVLVRPTNVVLLPALLVLLGVRWRSLLLFGLAGLPAAIWLGFYNNALYGGPLRSGYGDWKLSFKTEYFAPTIAHFTRWLLLLLPAALPLAALVAGGFRSVRSRAFVALALWFGAITGLYACYEVSREVWWCLRFILPAIPALILAGLLGIAAMADAFTRQPHRFRLVAASAIAAWALAGSTYWAEKLGVRLMKGYENTYANATVAARDRLPPNALVVAFHLSGSIYFYTPNPLLRWDQVEAPQFASYAARAQAARRDIYALVFDHEEKSQRERCPGTWTRVHTISNISLWRLAPSER